MFTKKIEAKILEMMLKIVIRLEILINKSVKLKIYLHDSNFYVIKKIRENRLKTRFIEDSEEPSVVTVEIVSGCNARCVMCKNSDSDKTPEIIDDLLFKKIIDEWAKLNTKDLWLNWIGEPLLDPRIAEKISYAKMSKKNSVIGLFSNASLLSEDMSKDIIESGLDRIVFSIDGYSKKTFENIRKGLTFENVVANVNGFIKLRKRMCKTRPIIDVNFVRTKFNIHEEEMFKKEWVPKVDNVIVGTGLTYHQEYAPTDVKIPVYKNKVPCPALWYYAPISANGLVKLCVYNATEDIIIGDVKKQSIKEIWNSDIFKKYRTYHLEGRFNELIPCNRCEFWKYVRSDMPWYGNY